MIDNNNGTAMAVRDEQRGQIATQAPPSPFEGFKLLTPRGAVDLPKRIQSLATVSAGYRGQNGTPVISRDGTIYLTDDVNHPATGLRQALEQTNYKRLTIAFGSDDLHAVMQQKLTLFSRTRLEMWGDHEQITKINENGSREQVFADTDRDQYLAWASKMKAETFFFFHLARWNDAGMPEIYLPDGLATYRLRTTSLNSAAEMLNQLQTAWDRGRGTFAGIPHDLFLTYRELADSKGAKRTVPIWTMVMRAPDDRAGSVKNVLTAGIEQARALSLPKPEILTVEQLALSGPATPDDLVVDGEGEVISEEQADLLRRGGPIRNVDRFRREYYYAAGKSSLRTEEGKSRFLLHWTAGQTGSITEYAATHTSSDGERLLEAVNKRQIEEIEARNAAGEPTPITEPETRPDRGRNYNETFPADDFDKPAPAISRQMATPEVEAAVALSGGPVASQEPAGEPQPLARPEEGKAYTRSTWVNFYTEHMARYRKLDVHQRPGDIDAMDAATLKAETLRIIQEADSLEATLAEDPAVEDDTTVEAF